MINKFLLSISLLLLIQFCDANGKKKIYIADRKIACKDILAGCLQVKENTKDTWQNFTGILSGFDYQEGYEYKVLIEIPGKEPFSPTRSNYKVLKVISKKKTDFNPASRLEAKKWRLTFMEDDQKSSLNMKDSTVFIKFNLKDNKVSGHTTCNGFSGTIQTVDGSNIKIGSLSATKMLCEGDNKMAFETIILKFIREATTFKIEGNKLTLLAPNGENLVFEGE